MGTARIKPNEAGQLRCSLCMEYKDKTEFYPKPSFGRGYGYNCIPCVAVVTRNSARRVLYGMEPDDYEAMLDSQFFMCLICGVDIEEVSREFDVDHCHDCNDVRGLLCGSCNKGLGNFKDNVAVLQKAIEYLEGHTHG